MVDAARCIARKEKKNYIVNTSLDAVRCEDVPPTDVRGLANRTA